MCGIINPVYDWVLPPAGLKPKTTRSAGQRLTYWATRVEKSKWEITKNVTLCEIEERHRGMPIHLKGLKERLCFSVPQWLVMAWHQSCRVATVREKNLEMKFFPGQGKVREFHGWSGKFGKWGGGGGGGCTFSWDSLSPSPLVIGGYP